MLEDAVQESEGVADGLRLAGRQQASGHPVDLFGCELRERTVTKVRADVDALHRLASLQVGGSGSFDLELLA